MPEADLASKTNILTFLFNKNLISAYKNYGVYEKQGLEFVEATLEPAVCELLKDWRTLGQFHMRPKHFKQGKMSFEGHTNIKLYLYKFIMFFSQIVTNPRSQLSKTEMYEQV